MIQRNGSDGCADYEHFLFIVRVRVAASNL